MLITISLANNKKLYFQLVLLCYLDTAPIGPLPKTKNCLAEYAYEINFTA